MATRREREAQERFSQRYGENRSDVVRRIELAVIGTVLAAGVADFAAAGAFFVFFTADLVTRDLVLVPDLAASNASASSSVRLSAFSPSGNVALTVPCLT